MTMLMDLPLIVRFPGPEQANRQEVGGKGTSLIRMIAADLPVPPGAVLTTTFFAPWFEEVKASATWIALCEAASEERGHLCTELKMHAQALPLTATQHDALAMVRRDLGGLHDEARFAVRSSSPEEDLTVASFAGGYETRLGVHPDDLEVAVRACFASSLDVRVFTYKEAHGFDVDEPRIAVVVQQQIDSEVAGVGFSLNPTTNDYDEAVIAANWGLGTSVVDGQVSPDHFVVDKVEWQVKEAIPGDKHVSVWLSDDRGTIERENEHAAERALTDDQLRELTEMICRIEALYERPVDIEWAYAEGDLYVLQARPITTYVLLPPEMVTEAGTPRQLYVDAALSKGLTTNAPISPLGLDNMKSLFSAIIASLAGPVNLDAAPHEALVFFAGGRMYMNYSNMMWMASPRLLAKSATPTDALMGEILANVDAQRYRAATRPPWASLRLLGLIPRIFWNMRGFFRNVLRALLAPERANRAYQRTIEAIFRELREQLDDGLPLDVIRRTYEARMAHEVFNIMMPVVVVGMMPPRLAVAGRGAEVKALADKLASGATDNVVVEMGVALYRLARLLDQSEFDSLDRLSRRIEQRELSQEFLSAWDKFLSEFGWRGPQETDVASPRYADDPRLALQQMSYMSGGDERFDPAAAHQRLVEERQHAYEALLQQLGPLRRTLLRWMYRRIGLFAGTRDTPKHLLVLFNYVIRKRVLAEGQCLVREDRLDAAEEVFGLTFDDLEAATRDLSLDLRAICYDRTRFHKKLKTHVTTFPAVIDSRGRIQRPPPCEEAPGLLSGMPVSPGVVVGPVKILHTSHEKPVERGDVLVAYTTDPGWTPLFVNAAAVVLEVGGILQHGAVVAREYGKPCVVGIDQVVATLRDGELVEVDGTAGTVRMLSRG